MDYDSIRKRNGGSVMNDFNFSYPTKVYFGKGGAKSALTAELGKY